MQKLKRQQGFVKPAGLIALAALVLILIAHFTLIKHTHAQAKTSPKESPLSIQQVTAMANSINSIINSHPDIDVGVAIVDLNNDRTEQYGVANPFEAASTTKLITAADFLHHVEDGDDDLHESINGKSAQYELQQMIEVSDDNAWQAFNDKLGHPELLSYASGIGLKDYDPDVNTLPANDIAILLKKLYQGQLLNQRYTKLLLDYMAVANYDGYIGGVIPNHVKFYHKAGVLEDRIHDAAIVDDGKRSLVIVIFTKNEDDENAASPDQSPIIQQIAAAALNAYSIN